MNVETSAVAVGSWEADHGHESRRPYLRFAAGVLAANATGMCSLLGGLIAWSHVLMIAGLILVLAAGLGLCLAVAGWLCPLGIEGVGEARYPARHPADRPPVPSWA